MIRPTWNSLNVGDYVYWVPELEPDVHKMYVKRVSRNSNKTKLSLEGKTEEEGYTRSKVIEYKEKDSSDEMKIVTSTFGSNGHYRGDEQDVTDKVFIYHSRAVEQMNANLLHLIDEQYDKMYKARNKIQSLRDKLYVK